MHIVIFSGGEIVLSHIVKEQLKSADALWGADSGATSALSNGILVGTVIGDFDSIDTFTKETLRKNNTEFLHYSSQKDETDTQLAIQFAVKKGAKKITIVGGVYGDRIDHILANILLTTKSKIPIVFVNGQQKVWTVKAPAEVVIPGHPGDILSLIPLSSIVESIITANLQYPLEKENLYFGQPRGVSNVFLSTSARIRWERGNLLFVQTCKK